MAESSLTLGFPELTNNVARYLGFDPTRANRSTAENTLVDELVNSGYRRFLAPDWRAAGLIPHQWSFLRVGTTLDTVADTRTVALPDDFAFPMCGALTYASDDDPNHTIPFRSQDDLDRLIQDDDDYSDKPVMAVVQPIAFDATTGQRWRVAFYPLPDDAYTLTYSYATLPDEADDTTNLYLHGGMLHGETLKAACRAVAELEHHLNAQGPEHANWLSRLRASYEADRRLFPRNYGYYRDRGQRHHHHGIEHTNDESAYLEHQ
jgi:hypothetical protein